VREATSLTWSTALPRLRLAHQLAREKNNPDLVELARKTGEEVRHLLARGDSTGAERLLGELESLAGIDPGGWSMAGQRIFRPEPGVIAAIQRNNSRLSDAMAKADVDAVRWAAAELKSVLGEQAGLPDARRPGRRAAIRSVSEAEAVTIFLKAMDSDRRLLPQVAAGEPLPGQMLRVYAGVILAVCDIRPAVQSQQPERLTDLDRLAAGACRILVSLQQPQGSFPLPDLRGTNLRFGDIIQRAITEQGAVVKDGWLVTPDPRGGTQFDTGLCGWALLAAGRTYATAAWTQAGLRAADWAAAQPCVANFNYNAFSATLLCQAYRETKRAAYRDAALAKYRIGLAPGQADNGRWIDPHNARTVYHQIILRALNDLAEVVSAEATPEVVAIEAALEKAMSALLDEWDAMGVTVHALPTLLRYYERHPGNHRVQQAIALAASVAMDQCVRGDAARFNVPHTEIAALTRVATMARSPQPR
jgi:hypothetical protein